MLHLVNNMNKIQIAGIEMHASHACNLNCEFCSHFTNYKIGGNVPVDLADDWMKAWNRRLKPARFTILGGEPCLNPDLCKYVEITRKNWPDSKIHVVTNGFLLHQHPDLPKVLKKALPSCLVISRHHNSKEYMDKYYKMLELAKQWQNQWGIEVELQQGITQWRKPYQKTNNGIHPYKDGDYKQSFQSCKMKNNCHNLLDYKLYKCAPLTYLNMMSEKYELSDEWNFYKNYKPLAPLCSNHELMEWVKQKAIPECGMCPQKCHYIKEIPNPL